MTTSRLETSPVEGRAEYLPTTSRDVCGWFGFTAISSTTKPSICVPGLTFRRRKIKGQSTRSAWSGRSASLLTTICPGGWPSGLATPIFLRNGTSVSACGLWMLIEVAYTPTTTSASPPPAGPGGGTRPQVNLAAYSINGGGRPCALAPPGTIALNSNEQDSGNNLCCMDIGVLPISIGLSMMGLKGRRRELVHTPHQKIT